MNIFTTPENSDRARRGRQGRRFGAHPHRGDGPHGGSHDGRGGRGPRGEGRGEREGRGGPWADFGPDFAEAGFDRPGRGGHGRPGPGPRRARRGDVRSAILSLLAEEPQNGYQAMSAIAERSDGLWRPGPGSVYPALSGLQDEGLIAPDETVTGRRKVYTLTDEGQAHVTEHAEKLAAAWEQATRPHQGYRSLRGEFGQVGMALQQVLAAGTPAQVEAVEAILADTRRAIYGVLASESDSGSEDTAPVDED